ncbi:SgcJ/EcaC family oxidoreductase [Variovorax paradoxus]|uniref:SgcJ/EcaC family oxidoreductase n=1 Tax=Variovorax paradoxus TaxID=34073 RepID=A0A5Q0M3B8_VARPD|nr:SgcJ/EcaC family oxidoreductase [Variovorax paradoxus]QFZ84023.1 SgcJ/EcaC family oxidoreductase [Variovorax paradoxus]
MRTFLRAVLATTALVAAVPVTSLAASPATAQTATAATTAIHQQLRRYEQALNTSDVDSVMALYADDAVFMPQNSPPAVGRDAVRTAYRQVFSAIKLDVRFQIDEVRQLSKDWAYARTRSNGTVKLLSSDQPPGAEANQELFVFHREADGQWRFARYIFATTNPPAGR